MTESVSATPITAPAAPTVPSAVVALGITALVIIALLPWFLIGGRFIEPFSLFGGILAAWFWLNVEQAQRARAPHVIVGALVGLALSWLPLLLAAQMGTSGIIIALLAMVLAIFLDIIAAVPLAVNKSTMLFLTVAAAPVVQLHVNFPQLMASTVIGGLYFIAFTEAVKWVATRPR